MIKRIFDITVSLLVLIIFFPLLFIICLIKLSLRDSLFFYQVRPGLNGKSFKMIKFCSMNNAKDNEGNLLPDEQRLTFLGRILRKTSLDELPELWNVLKGDMSLVGPRPLLMEYIPLYDSRQFRRHEVRPGVTGWAQVNGRNSISWEQKFEYDVWYVDNHSFRLDIKILFLTVKKVLFCSDISAEGDATMPKFNGSK